MTGNSQVKDAFGAAENPTVCQRSCLDPRSFASPPAKSTQNQLICVWRIAPIELSGLCSAGSASAAEVTGAGRRSWGQSLLQTAISGEQRTNAP